MSWSINNIAKFRFHISAEFERNANSADMLETNICLLLTPRRTYS